MTSLQQLLAAALDSSSSDNELAKALVDSGALEEIVRLGTYDDATVFTLGAALEAELDLWTQPSWWPQMAAATAWAAF